MKYVLPLFMFLLSLQLYAAPATEAEIADLYRSVLEREQDKEGALFWLKSGLNKEEIKKEFLKSPEYKDLVKRKLKK